MGKIAYPHAGRVIDRIGDSGGSANYAYLAAALHSKRIEMCFPFVDKDDVYSVHICIYRNVVLGEIVIEEAAVAMIDHGFFVKCHTDSTTAPMI